MKLPEPVAWIQSSHLDLAKHQVFLCRLAPVELHTGDIPLVTISDANAAITEAYAQGKKDALIHAAKVVELFDDATMQNDYMIDSGDCAEILVALAAAPKQEK